MSRLQFVGFYETPKNMLCFLFGNMRCFRTDSKLIS